MQAGPILVGASNMPSRRVGRLLRHDTITITQSAGALSSKTRMPSAS
jgi:hypothetical protein